MTAITRCPQCSTRFKAAQEQLDAHGGMVRCGRCQAVFNAVEHLLDTEPSPQLSLPIMLEIRQAEQRLEQEGESASQPAQPPAEPAQAGEVAALEQQIVIPEESFRSPHKPAGKRRTWPWAIGNLLLLLLLLAQAAYFFRIELAARLPGLKPALQTYCRLTACSIPLPQKADQMGIESSDMEADPLPATTITLNAVLRNRAPYAQAYPSLELTLTDMQDKMLARRNFRPSDYLKPGEDETLGLPPNRETGVKLHLDTTDLRPAGYRLFLYYP